MRKLTLLIAAMFIGLAAAIAQSPAPEPDTLKDPVKQTDPELKSLPNNQDKYHKEDVRITPTEVPRGIRKTLESSPQYTGWEKAMLYKNKTGNKYVIEITKADTTHTYTFDKSGRPIKE